MRDVLLAGKQLVEVDPHGDRCPAVRVALIDGDQDRHGRDEVRGLLAQDCPLPERLGHKIDLEVRQVSEPPVHQARGLRAHARRIIALLEKQRRKPAKRGIPRHPRAGYTAADDYEVENAIMFHASPTRNKAPCSKLWD